MKQMKASVVELVDTLDLGSSAARCESSSLSTRIVVFPLIGALLFLLLSHGFLDIFLGVFTFNKLKTV